MMLMSLRWCVQMASDPAPVDLPEYLCEGQPSAIVILMLYDVSLLVARVPDDQADVSFLRKPDTRRYVGCRRYVDGELDVVAQHAGYILGGEGVAATVGEEWCHDGARRVIVLLRPDPIVAETLAFGRIVDGIVAGCRERYCGHQPAADRLVQLTPVRRRRPALVSREAAAVLRLHSADDCAERQLPQHLLVSHSKKVRLRL